MAPHTPVAVLQAAKPEEMEAWKMHHDALVEAFHVNSMKFKADMDALEVYYQRSYKGLSISGWKPSDPAAPLPEGWRRERDGQRMIVPALRTKVGKAQGKLLSDLSVELPPAPGLPDIVWGQGYMGRFHIEALNGRWYASLGFNLRTDEPLDAQGIDTGRWLPAPLSRYHSDREVMEAFAAARTVRAPSAA